MYGSKVFHSHRFGWWYAVVWLCVYWSCVSRSEGTFAASAVLSEHHTTAQCLLLILNLRPCLYTYICASVERFPIGESQVHNNDNIVRYSRQMTFYESFINRTIIFHTGTGSS